MCDAGVGGGEGGGEVEVEGGEVRWTRGGRDVPEVARNPKRSGEAKDAGENQKENEWGKMKRRFQCSYYAAKDTHVRSNAGGGGGNLTRKSQHCIFRRRKVERRKKARRRKLEIMIRRLRRSCFG